MIANAPTLVSRQKLLTASSRQTLLAALAAASSCCTFAAPPPALAASVTLSARLASRDAKQLAKPIFNMAPPEAAYPDWLDGTWKTEMGFGGYELPAKDLFSREELFAEATVPGFQKVSIALIPDVGKERVTFDLRFAKDPSGIVREDRASNLRSAIRGGLGYDAIERVEYKEDPMIPNPFGVNPNRLSLVFARGLTLNAERVELFVNSRETERVSEDTFLTSEYVRQVTFSASRTSVARQVSGEYNHFITYKRRSPNEVVANILTAVYAEPLQQERFFIKAPTRPILVYSHVLRMERAGP